MVSIVEETPSVNSILGFISLQNLLQAFTLDNAYFAWIEATSLIFVMNFAISDRKFVIPCFYFISKFMTQKN